MIIKPDQIESRKPLILHEKTLCRGESYEIDCEEDNVMFFESFYGVKSNNDQKCEYR